MCRLGETLHGIIISYIMVSKKKVLPTLAVLLYWLCIYVKTLPVW